MTQQKKDILKKGTKKIQGQAHPIRWRALYRTVHQIKAQQEISDPNFLERAAKIILPKKLYDKLSEIPSAYQFAKLTMLQQHRGKRIKDFAKHIMLTMIESMLDTGHDLIVLNYETADEHWRMNFAQETLMDTHRRISQQIPEVAPALRRVIFNKDYNKKNKQKNNFTTHAYYSSSRYEIGFCPEGLAQKDIKDLIATMAHEYVHVLQAAYKSTLPTPILKLSWEHHSTMHRFPHDLRPIEKEANRVGRLVKHNFQKFYDKLSDEYYATHD